jgi:hypothetical protein
VHEVSSFGHQDDLPGERGHIDIKLGGVEEATTVVGHGGRD